MLTSEGRHDWRVTKGMIFAALFTVGISVSIHVLMWVLDQSFLVIGMPLPSYLWALAQAVQAGLLAIVIVALQARSRTPGERIVYGAARSALGLLLLFAVIRLVPAQLTQLAALVQIAVTFIALVVTVRGARRAGLKFPRTRTALWLGAATGFLALLPWVAYGALGSPVDTFLNLLAAFGFGLLFGVTLQVTLLHHLPEGTTTGTRVLAVSVAGVMMLMLASGFGFDGSQLILTLALPAVAIAAVAAALLSRRARDAWYVAGIGVSIATVGPLLFLDPDELTLLLGLSGEGEVLSWAIRAAALTALTAAVLLSALSVLRRWLVDERLLRARALSLLAAAALACLVVYAIPGQPGFYGERLFVILNDQADLSAVGRDLAWERRVDSVYRLTTAHAERTQASLRAELDRLRVPYKPYYLVNALEVDAGPLIRAYLSSRPDVDRILASPHLRPLPSEPGPARGFAEAPAETPWNITSIGADRVWQDLGVRGSGVVVGVSDSGVDGSHPALATNYRGTDSGDHYNWLDPWSGTGSPRDVTGHGTHTTGSATGTGGIGVAPDAEWFACVNLERNIGNPGWYLTCMQFMLAPYPQAGDAFRDGDPVRAAHVLNNSWGCTGFEGCDTQALQPAVDALRSAGIFVVASAGNEGPFCSSVSDPIAIYSSVFSVGAIDAKGNIPFFSSRGPVTSDGSRRIKPDLVAPGEDVLSSFPGGSYELQAGTSMAGPHVAGVVALMWSAQPLLVGDVERTEQILRETARPYVGNRSGCFSDGTPNNAYGYGVLDAYAAVRRALEMVR